MPTHKDEKKKKPKFKVVPRKKKEQDTMKTKTAPMKKKEDPKKAPAKKKIKFKVVPKKEEKPKPKKKIKFKVKPQPKKLEIEKRTGKTKEELKKADPVDLIKALPGELQKKIVGTKIEITDIKPMLDKLKGMAGYKKREVNKELQNIMAKNSVTGTSYFTKLIENTDNILSRMEADKDFRMKPLVREMKQYLENKIRELAPADLKRQERAKKESQRDRTTKTLKNFLSIAPGLEDLDDYDANVYENVYRFSEHGDERLIERRMDRVYSVVEGRRKRLRRDFFKRESGKYKTLDELGDAYVMAFNNPAKGYDLDDYIINSERF